MFEWLARATAEQRLVDVFLRGTELARGQNLLDVTILSDCLDAEEDPTRRELLKELRIADVELEVSTIAGDLDSDALRQLRIQRQRIRGALDIDRNVAENSAEIDAAKLVGRVVALGAVILSLFDTKHGVAAVVVRPDGTRDGTFLKWERAGRNLHPSRHSPFGRGARNFGVDVSDLQATLLETFFSPLAKLIGVDADVLVIPHGQLAALPFWPLIDLVAPNRALCISPSLAIHGRCGQRVRADRGKTVFVCDPTRSLRHAEWEIANVATARADAARLDAITLNDLLASSDSCVLHIAAHGEFNSDNPYRTGLLFADDGGAGRFAAYSDNPRRRIGTVAEIMTQMHLPLCRLAVLSACETAVSHPHVSGEMVGLPSALLSVGARSVIASSWRVDDAAAAILMHYFYATWIGGAGNEPSPARALAIARSQLRSTPRDAATRLLEAPIHGNADPPFNQAEFCDAFACYGAF